METTREQTLDRVPRILIGPDEAADSLGISTRTLRRWVTDHGLPSITVGGSVRFSPKALEDWAAEQYARQMTQQAQEKK